MHNANIAQYNCNDYCTVCAPEEMLLLLKVADKLHRGTVLVLVGGIIYMSGTLIYTIVSVCTLLWLVIVWGQHREKIGSKKGVKQCFS